MTRTDPVPKSSRVHGDGWLSLLTISALALAFLALVPAVSVAQSGIAGIVKDTSGAVLPGVTVEAASPALIEKVRTVVTDEQGRYNIVDLRPGIYTVTFTLPGFNTVKREGIDLPSAFTATVNADLPVGALEEDGHGERTGAGGRHPKHRPEQNAVEGAAGGGPDGTVAPELRIFETSLY